MTGHAQAMPGLEPIRQRFRSMLAERKSDIAFHILEAWNASQDARGAEVVAGNLEDAQRMLHKIAGSAGSLGFGELGEAAFQGENEIIALLGLCNGAPQAVSDDVMNAVDAFLICCDTVMDEAA